MLADDGMCKRQASTEVGSAGFDVQRPVPLASGFPFCFVRDHLTTASHGQPAGFCSMPMWLAPRTWHQNLEWRASRCVQLPETGTPTAPHFGCTMAQGDADSGRRCEEDDRWVHLQGRLEGTQNLEFYERASAPCPQPEALVAGLAGIW